MWSSAANILMRARFPKRERLSGKTEISELFSKGSFFYLGPFKVFFLLEDRNVTEPPQLLVSVPKSKFSHATDRNLLKRRIREAYRNSKAELLDRLSGSGINLKKIGLVYVEDELFSFVNIKAQIMKIPGLLKKGSKK